METVVLLLCALGLAVAAPDTNNSNLHQLPPINVHVTSNLEQKTNVSNNYAPNYPGHCADGGDPACNQGKEKKFYLQNFAVNWFKAYELCRLNGKRLATISNEEENNRLKNMLKKYSSRPRDVWLSGTDMALEGSFTWMSTGLPFTFTDWVKGFGDPNNYNGENCVHIGSYHNDYYWNDGNCNNTFFFVCESY